MDVRQYLDSTYLKSAEQAGLSQDENLEVAMQLVREAIEYGFKLVMLRPEWVAQARACIDGQSSAVLLGTVIDFPLGQGGIGRKLEQASEAIADGADELDFVLDYEAFKRGETELMKTEVLECTRFALSHHKTVKWIIEIAALDELQIAQASALVKHVVVGNFKEEHYARVFVKSSTGFYITEDGKPNGATVEAMIIMLENACPLPVKAAGGVRTYDEAAAMIRIGVRRIGTSSAAAIVNGAVSATDY